MSKKIRVLDLFCGCGGSSLGFKLALEEMGFQPEIVGVDIDRDACLSFQRNRVGQAIRADARYPPIILREGTFDIVIGCPPCQGFTRLRKKKVNSEDERNHLVDIFLMWVEKLRPKYVVFENVPQIRYSEHYHYLLNGLTRLGYKYREGILNAADFCVPQRRKRLILVASLEKEPKLPAPVGKKVTVGEAIGDLPPLKAGEKHPSIPNHEAMKHSEAVLKRIRSVPKNGGSRRDVPRELWLKCHLRCDGYRDVYGRMRWDDVAPTLTSGCINPSKGRFIHPEQDRAITPREAARLQTFPDWFIFYGGSSSISRQIGNAMPVQLAKSIAKVLFFDM